MTLHVRYATPEDFMRLRELSAQLHEENGAVDVSWPLVDAQLMRGINRQRAFIGVIGTPECLEGMICVQFASMWYSSTVILEELFNFVAKPFRRQPHAKAMLDFARGAAASLDTPLLIGVISNHRTAAKIRMYERTFGPMSGAFFLHNPSEARDVRR